MKNLFKGKKGFTLVELVISITILGIIIVSVMSIFISNSDISMKSDINRSMQENIKNVFETISEDIRKNGVKGISISIPDSNCNSGSGNISNFFSSGTKLCTNLNEYYLGDRDGNRVLLDSCDEIKEHCIIVKNGIPLTNSFVSVKNLEFIYGKSDIPTITILLTLEPAIDKGVKLNLIKENKITLQTTITTRPF